MKKKKYISEKKYFLEKKISKQEKVTPPPIHIDTKKMEEEVPDQIKFAAHMTIENQKALEYMVNCIEFCPDRKQKKSGYVIKNLMEGEKVKQLIYFFADDKYTCRRINKLFKAELPWIRLDKE